MKTECWLWEGTLNTRGYGQCQDAQYRGKLAHRVSYEFLGRTHPGRARARPPVQEASMRQPRTSRASDAPRER